MLQTGQEATSTYKPQTKCPENLSEAGYDKNELSIIVENIDPHVIDITESWANKDNKDTE